MRKDNNHRHRLKLGHLIRVLRTTLSLGSTIPDLRKRVEALEQENSMIKAAYTDLTNRLGRQKGMIATLFGWQG